MLAHLAPAQCKQKNKFEQTKKVPQPINHSTRKQKKEFEQTKAIARAERAS